MQKQYGLSHDSATAGGLLSRIRSMLRSHHAEILEALLAAVDAKDAYTRTHSIRVAGFADAVARRMGVSGSQRRILRTASLLHDIGKIGIPDRILNKPGRLTADEFNVIKTHPQLAVEILQPFRALRDHRRIILHHHERFDGAGYPAGLHGHAIPMGSRILAVLDAIDTMISERNYKPAMSVAEARAEVVAQSGKQFDPQVALTAVEWMDAEMMHLDARHTIPA